MKFVYILAAVLIFGVLIAIHELGHFLAAKLCGVRVNEFSIGMGPLLWKKETEETCYSLRLLPIGGFCAMEGEDEDTGDSRSFVRQGFWKKFAILATGPFMNFVAGFLVLLVLFGNASAFYLDKITGFAEGFPLEGENGLMAGDVFYKIDGYRVYLHGDAALFLQYNDGKGVDLEVIRNGEKVVLKDFPMYREDYDGQNTRRFGVNVGVEEIPATFFSKIQYAWYQAMDFVQLVWFSLVQLVTGNAGVNDLSGPVGIVSAITEVGETSATPAIAAGNIAYFAALIAVNLAVMNLLPVPALDGGRIFFLAIDAVAMALFRRKVPEKYQAAVNMAGFALLMGFMLLVTVHDVFKLFQ